MNIINAFEPILDLARYTNESFPTISAVIGGIVFSVLILRQCYHSTPKHVIRPILPQLPIGFVDRLKEIYRTRVVMQDLYGSSHAISWDDICCDSIVKEDPKSDLYVVELSTSKAQRVMNEIVAAWADSLSKITLEESDLNDSKILSKQSIEDFNKYRKNLRVCVTGNKCQGIQGVMIWKDLSQNREYEIEMLMANPLNLKSPFTSHLMRIRGGGSSLLNYLKMKCRQNNASIWLTPYDRSLPFYQRQGFSSENDLCVWRS